MSWFVFSSLTSFRQFLLRGGLATVFQEATDVCRQKMKHDFNTFWLRPEASDLVIIDHIIVSSQSGVEDKAKCLFRQETQCDRL